MVSFLSVLLKVLQNNLDWQPRQQNCVQEKFLWGDVLRNNNEQFLYDRCLLVWRKSTSLSGRVWDFWNQLWAFRRVKHTLLYILAIRPGDLELIRNAIEDHTSSTSSLAVYSSFASLNVDREIKPYTGCRSSKCKVGTTFQDRTLSLLELLYEQERGVNVWNITNVYNNIFIPRNDLFDSDTALDERSSLSEQHGSFIRRYVVNI